jgi:hypothetical protein
MADLPLSRTPRTLSSRQTALMKFIVPPVWILAFGAAVLMLWSERADRSPIPIESKWMVLLVWLVGGLLIWRTCARLKRVQVDGGTLLVSDYRTTIRVPAGDIEEVTENRWISMHPVTLHFRRPTEFGNEVVFMPKVRAFGFVSSHPVVAELRALAQGRGDRLAGPHRLP